MTISKDNNPMMDEEKLRLIISQETYSAIAKSLTNGLGAKVREVARIEAANIIEAHESVCGKMQAEHASAERWKLVAIVAICSTVGGGGGAIGLLKLLAVKL